MPTCVTRYQPLAKYTTLGIGGAAEYLATITTRTELTAVMQWVQAESLPWRVLGGGSNILVSDTGVSGVVIHIQLKGSTVVDEVPGAVIVRYEAGEIFDECVAHTVQKGWWGLENLSHIPGTVGATPVQNVGAYGVEVGAVIADVEVYDTVTETYQFLTPADCGFGYRTSHFKTTLSSFIITSVAFRLQTTPSPVLTYAGLAELSPTSSQATIRQHVIEIRSQKFPDWTVVGTAGSFFKNPIVTAVEARRLRAQYPELPMYIMPDGDSHKVLLGYVLDKICGLRGFQIGRVRLFENQALVLVTEHGATAAEVDEFVAVVSACVHEYTGIVIEREVVHW